MTDKTMEEFRLMSEEAVDLLPDGMKRAALLAFQAVMLSHGREYRKSQEKLRLLRSESYSREPYLDILSAENEMKAAETLAGDTPEKRRHLSRARASLSSYFSSDNHKRPEKEVYKAMLMKARVDYMLYHRKGIFMGIIELPENTEVNDISKAAKGRGLRVLSSSKTFVLMEHSDGGIFAASLEDPDLVVVAGLSRQMDIIETAAAFIRMAHSVMTYYSSTSLYINGVMLSADDVDEALQDISDDSFPVWFFARGGEEEMEDGTFVLTAEGAESFGAKIIKIVGVSQEYKEEASNALSLILVYHVFSPSARRSASYAIGDYIYQLSSSDKYTVSYSMKRGDHGRIQT